MSKISGAIHKRPTHDGKQVRPGRGKPGRDLERHSSKIR